MRHILGAKLRAVFHRTSKYGSKSVHVLHPTAPYLKSLPANSVRILFRFGGVQG